jgi:F0F1-type ATP synthase membrane subunit c/vacuolar-type H+-ATPase subunit K
MNVSIVEVGIAVGGMLLGKGVGVNATIGASNGVQAVRRNKEAMMNFFMKGIICHCEPERSE